MSHGDVIKRPRAVDPDWKKRVAATLHACGLCDDDFKGTLEFHIHSGGIGSLTEKRTRR